MIMMAVLRFVACLQTKPTTNRQATTKNQRVNGKGKEQKNKAACCCSVNATAATAATSYRYCYIIIIIIEKKEKVLTDPSLCDDDDIS